MNPNDRLKQIRLFLKHTQKEMAEKAGIPFRTLQNYEANKREISSKALSLIYTHLGINPIWILTGEGEMLCKSICGGLKQDIDHNIVSDSLGDGVIMLTKIHSAKNRTHYDNTIKYLKHTVDIVEMEERKDSEKK